MDEQNPTPQSQPPRKRRTAAQLAKDQRARKAKREADLAAKRKEKKNAHEVRNKKLVDDRARFWSEYLNAQQRGVRTDMERSLGVHRSTITNWLNGGGWKAENTSMLLDQMPSLFDDDQRADLIRLSLRSCGYSDDSVQAITSLSEWNSKQVRELRRQEVEWFSTVIADAAVEIISALTTPPSSNGPEDPRAHAAYSVLNRICSYYDTRYNAKQSVRACIFMPMAADPTLIEIRWSKWVDGESHRWNHWYIGEDPVPRGRKRGLAGRTWRASAGQWFPRNVFDNPDFEDQRVPPRAREEMPYDSLVQAQILGTGQKVLGLLSVDSLKHEFGALDLEFMNRAMLLLAPFLDTADRT